MSRPARHPKSASGTKTHTASIAGAGAGTCGTHRRKRPVRRVVDQVLVVRVHVRDRDVGVRPELPIVRVVRPDDRDEPKPVRDAANAIVDVTVWGLCAGQQADTGRRAALGAHPPAGRRDAGDELDGLHLL